MIREPTQFAEAHALILAKIPEGQPWDSEMWRAQEVDVRTRAFFSARVENARFLDRAQGLIQSFLKKETEEIVRPDGTKENALKIGSRADFVKIMREFQIKEGMASKADYRNVQNEDITDIFSMSRLRLIFDTNTRSAYGYGSFIQGMEPAVLDSFPAARFLRNPGADEKRIRHQQSEGAIALKTDFDYWADFQNADEIGGFEVPWAPFGFHSFMEKEDVSRAEAESQGLIKAGERVGGDELPSLNDKLKASLKRVDPKIKERLREALHNEQAQRRSGVKEKEESPAKKAARKARKEAILRSLSAAKARSDLKEVRRIDLVLEREARLQEQMGRGLKFDFEFDAIKLAIKSPTTNFSQENPVRVVKTPAALPSPQLFQHTDQERASIQKAAYKKETVLGGGVNSTIVIENGRKAVFKSMSGEAVDLRGAKIPNFEQYRREVGASMIDEILGLDMVPNTAMVEYQGEIGSAQIFKEGFKTPSALKLKNIEISPVRALKNILNDDQLEDLQLLDDVLAHLDRHRENVLLKKVKGAYQVAMIDNGLSLPVQKTLKRFAGPLEGGSIPKRHLDSLKELGEQLKFQRSTFISILGDQAFKLLVERVGLLRKSKTYGNIL